MIALDTNILVRYFAAEEDTDSRKAAVFIETELTEANRGFVSAVTICEIVWVLRSRYGFAYAAQAAIIRLLLDAAQIVVEHRESVTAALDSNHVDIADAIIHFIGAKHCCSVTLTLDKKFARLEGVELLA